MTLQHWTKRLYLFIVFIFGWGSAAVSIATENVIDPYLALICGMSPLCAALITYMSQNPSSFLARIHFTFPHTYWWLGILLLPISFFAVLYASYELTIPSIVWNPFFLTGVLLIVLCHEIGWRGFLHCAAPPHHFWRTSFLVGFASSCWHIPIWLIFFSVSNETLLIIACYLMLTAAPLSFVTIVSRSIVMTTILQTGLFLIMFVAITSTTMTFIMFSLLLILNGIVMLLHNK
ncbi:hypothetical protein [Shouchella lonarensis]|uniref:CAAX protease self-immunity n=1 Tax=Shouchella lonarensis TaxID=1464122 RepID=A0A1G6MQI7_9BACI|nr:hypothetical protein [Shouchella lonarensis]SDC57266.1 hypothetical protein SAMN05421737_11094 [Shouchella lonarensis]